MAPHLNKGGLGGVPEVSERDFQDGRDWQDFVFAGGGGIWLGDGISRWDAETRGLVICGCGLVAVVLVG